MHRFVLPPSEQRATGHLHMTGLFEAFVTPSPMASFVFAAGGQPPLAKRAAAGETGKCKEEKRKEKKKDCGKGTRTKDEGGI